MMIFLLCLIASLPVAAEGTLEPPFRLPSSYVPERAVQVWLPPGYSDSDARYPVLYMHDGQNVFARAETGRSGFGSWELDLVLERLLAERAVRPAIVVAIHNTPNRTGEYMPQAAAKLALEGGDAIASSRGIEVAQEDIRSDDYLKYIVEELKPYIDARYRTAHGIQDTLVMGSSMGGLISLYALMQYPDVFGAAACLSTHWPIGNGVAVDYLEGHLPDSATHRVYFDRGTETLDASYAGYQDRADRIMLAHGYEKGANFESLVFNGAEHNEASWAKRLDVPLKFLLGK